MPNDEELDALRQRRMQELQAQADAQQQQQQASPEAQAQAEAQRQQAEAKRQALLRQVLTTEARSRLKAIAMARPKLARNVEDQLLNLAMSGRVRDPITEEQLKRMLSQVSENKREIRIERR